MNKPNILSISRPMDLVIVLKQLEEHYENAASYAQSQRQIYPITELSSKADAFSAGAFKGNQESFEEAEDSIRQLRGVVTKWISRQSFKTE